MNIQSAARITRLPQPFFTNLVNTASELRKQGADVIDLGRGAPDLATPPHVLAALWDAAQNPVYHRYSPFEGYPQIREGVAHWYRQERGVEIDPHKEAAVLFGSRIGLIEICEVLLEPGDICLVPDPGYPDYLSGIALTGASPYPIPLLPENNFLPDFSLIPDTVLRKAKLMFLNYPGNPTATLAPRSFFAEAVAFARRYNIVIAHDYAYGAIGFDGQRPVSFLEVPGAKEVGIEFYSLSKTYNMSGWRVGFALGNARVVGLINALQDHLFVSIPPAIQMMATIALTGPQSYVDEMVAVYENRRNVFMHALSEMGWEANPPQGSFFAWLPVPKGLTSVEFSDILLSQAHVVVAPGIGFGSHGEGYVRAGLLVEPGRLVEAAERIKSLYIW